MGATQEKKNMMLSGLITPYCRSVAPWRRAGLIVLVYAGLAGLGLGLISAESYASPIFPASGFALAMALIYGLQALPAIWLASCLVNIGLGLATGGSFPAVLPTAMLIGLGAALQAFVGGRLVLSLLGDGWQKLEDEKSAALFLIWGGVLACLVSATVGVLSLGATGVLPSEALLTSWMTWYVGDLLGVLVFAPVALATWGREDALWATRLRSAVLPTLTVAALAILASLVTARWENEAERQTLNQESERVAQRVADRLATRLAAHREALSSLRHFVETYPNAQFAEFEQFTRETLAQNPDVFALSINDRVFDSNRAAFEAAVAKLSPTGAFQIKQRVNGQVAPALTKPEYFPVRFIAPLDGNAKAIGFDIFSEPVRRDAIERALSTSNMAITAPIQLVQDQVSRTGILQLMPYFRVTENLRPNARPQVAGLVVSVVKLDEMMDLKAWGALDSPLVFQLTDPKALSTGQLLFRSDAKPGDSSIHPIENAAWSRPIDFADRQWLLSVYAPTGVGAETSIPSAYWVGIVGLLISGMLQLMMLGMTGRNQQLAEAHGQLKKLALYDPLTELPNRSLFFDRLRMDMLHGRRDNKKHALLFVDLDFFKAINDEHGHAAGDYVLRESARRMRNLVREADTIGRIGGDEFVVLLHHVTDAEAATTVAEKLLSALNEPLMWRGLRLKVSASIGLALFPDHGNDEDTLTSRADAAMYASKAAGRGRVVVFSPALSPSSPEPLPQ